MRSVDLMNYDLPGLREFFVSIGEKPFRATQLINWIHQRRQLDFTQMTNISKSLREQLKQVAEFKLPKVVLSQSSSDGTQKWLLELDADKQGMPNNRIEMVYIPEENRGTLCISSQVGCSLDCSFCSTATQGFNRNLTTAEIIGQLWLAIGLLAESAPAASITNVVLMGMGEPLLNYKHVIPAIRLMLDDQAYGLSKRRVTLSTAGIVPAIDALREDVDVSLAVSLHAPNDALRDKLVPVNKKFPLEALLAACRRYVVNQAKKRITFEYVMLEDVNDQIEHAKQLTEILKGIPCKINLIPFNPFPKTSYRCSEQPVIAKFSKYLQHRGYLSTIRKTRGDDIDAACGQLVGQVDDRSHRQLRATRLAVSS